MEGIAVVNPTCSDDELSYDTMIDLMDKPQNRRGKFIKLSFYPLVENELIKSWMDDVFLPMNRVKFDSNFAIFFYKERILAVVEFKGIKHSQEKEIVKLNSTWFWNKLEQRSPGDLLRRFFDDKLLRMIMDAIVSIEMDVMIKNSFVVEDAMDYSDEDSLSIIGEDNNLLECPECGATDPDHGDENGPCPVCDGKLTRKR